MTYEEKLFKNYSDALSEITELKCKQIEVELLLKQHRRQLIDGGYKEDSLMIIKVDLIIKKIK